MSRRGTFIAWALAMGVCHGLFVTMAAAADLVELGDYGYPTSLVSLEWAGTDSDGNPTVIKTWFGATRVAMFRDPSRTVLFGYAGQHDYDFVSSNEEYREYTGLNSSYVYCHGGDYPGESARFDPVVKLPRLVEIGKVYSFSTSFGVNGVRMRAATFSVKVSGRTSVSVPAGDFTDVIRLENKFTGTPGGRWFMRSSTGQWEREGQFQ